MPALTIGVVFLMTIGRKKLVLVFIGLATIKMAFFCQIFNYLGPFAYDPLLTMNQKKIKMLSF